MKFQFVLVVSLISCFVHIFPMQSEKAPNNEHGNENLVVVVANFFEGHQNPIQMQTEEDDEMFKIKQMERQFDKK